jgi:hypothetical protein
MPKVAPLKLYLIIEFSVRSLSSEMGCGGSGDSLVQVGQNEEHCCNTNHVGIQIVSVHHGHRIPSGVVVLEVKVVTLVVKDNVGHGRDSVGKQRTSIDCFS